MLGEDGEELGVDFGHSWSKSWIRINTAKEKRSNAAQNKLRTFDRCHFDLLCLPGFEREIVDALMEEEPHEHAEAVDVGGRRIDEFQFLHLWGLEYCFELYNPRNRRYI